MDKNCFHNDTAAGFRYTGTKCPAQDTSCLSTAASDVARVSRLAGGGSKLSVRIVFGQGHICQMEGPAQWRDGTLILRADALDPNAPCELHAKIQGSILTLEDTGGRCQPVYCGARGMLQGARFTRRQ